MINVIGFHVKVLVLFELTKICRALIIDNVCHFKKNIDFNNYKL